MRPYIICYILILTIVSSKKDYDLSTIEEDSEDEEPDYIPHVETTLDFRGTVRKHFAFELGLSANGRNIICSPISAMLPLAKLALGAKKDSRAEYELLSALGLKNRNQLKYVMKQALKELEYLEGVEISLASRLYLSKKFKLRRNFKRRSESIFKSAVELIDVSRPHESAKEINDWVYENTGNRIKNMINPSDIGPSVSLLLANAIYFRGRWKDRFHKTFNAIFHSPTGAVTVPMMTRSGQYNYIQCDILNAQVVEIPYVGENAAMIIVLPYAKNGLQILLRMLKVSSDILNESLMKMKTAGVTLTIPKFTIQTSLDLRHYYKKMNVQTVLRERKSGLDRIVKPGSVYLSSAIQKAMIEVHESGTEAAAASVVGLKPVSGFLTQFIFKADHPFLFFIRANHDQLFSGVVNSPK